MKKSIPFLRLKVLTAILVLISITSSAQEAKPDSIGYRMQKPNGHFIFRTGVGWPEALYIDLGVSF